jgi:hypothetical protein
MNSTDNSKGNGNGNRYGLPGEEPWLSHGSPNETGDVPNGTTGASDPPTDRAPAAGMPAGRMRKFRSAKEDKTAKLVLGAIGVLVVGVLMLMGLSEKGRQKPKKSGEASLGRPHQEQVQQGTTSAGSSLVPGGSMQPVAEDKHETGSVSARDIENTKMMRDAAADGGSGVAPTAKTLAQIPPFNAGNGQSSDNWAPPAFGASRNAAEENPEKSVENALAKPSLVFTAAESLKTAGAAGMDDLPMLDLGIGSRLSARLASAVTSAVNQPVIALIEYNYEHDGVILVPAGSKAVGKLVQADRSGYVQLHFDHLEMPSGADVAIDALGTDTDLGPLKGKVTGTHRGQNFAVRALTGVGQMSAMLVGQGSGGINGAVSEADLMRMQMAENIGRAGDQEVTQMMLTVHPIVTLPAGLRIYVVFEKHPSQNTPVAQSSPSTGIGSPAQMPAFRSQ